MHKNDQIIQLEEKIISANNEYYNTGSSLVSDDIYNLWIETLGKLDPDNVLLSQIGAEPTSEWKKEKLSVPLLSLDKAQNVEQFLLWINKYKNYSLIISDKLDGISVLCSYIDGKFIKAITRGGSAGIGENISQNVIKMSGIKQQLPINFTGHLRGEIVLTKENHQKYFSDYANPRNAASGIARRYDGEGCEHLNVYFYNVFSELTFISQYDIFKFISKELQLQTPNYGEFNNYNDAISFWQKFKENEEEKLPYVIDGLVCQFSDLNYAKSLGENRHHPHYAIAMKFPPEVKPTKLIELSWELGNSGRLTPVAILEPVSLAGTIVKRANLHNVSNLKRLGAVPGSVVAVAKRNEIIPQVEEVLEKAAGQIIYPKTCPACGSNTEFSGEYLICPNISECPAHLSGRLRNWINTLNILSWGTVVCDNIVEFGNVKTIVDLYKLSIEDLMKLPRMGEKSATKLLRILHENKTITLEKFIGGLSIPMIGTTIGSLLVEYGYDTIDKLMLASINDFEKINGLGPAKAKFLYDGLKANTNIIKGLLDAGIKIKEKIKGKLNGKSFCFTGEMSHPREELIQFVIDNGGIVKSSVVKNLSYLVIADPNSQTTKAKAARKNGTKCVSEQELFDMIG